MQSLAAEHARRVDSLPAEEIELCGCQSNESQGHLLPIRVRARMYDKASAQYGKKGSRVNKM